MKTLLIAVLVLQFSAFAQTRKNRKIISAKDVENVPDLIHADGYPVEIHHVVTADGYTLELHRIPWGRNQTSEGGSGRGQRGAKPAVLLVHCILCSSAAFVVLGPNGALAYMLANSGRDVWMLNTRGSKYSQKHDMYHPDSRQFWQFRHEQGVFDLPAAIDLVLAETGHTQLDLVAFSIGATQTIVLLSERPEYNNKVMSVTALAPAVFIGGARWSLVNFSPSFVKTIVGAAARTGQLEASGAILGLNRVLARMCSRDAEDVCSRAVELVGGGRRYGNVNKRLVPFFFRFVPDATSVRTLIHFHQNHVTGEFRKYNYGRRRNLAVYGSPTPPAYNLSRVTAPTTVLWSRGDDVTVTQDVKRLIGILPNIVSTYEVPEKTYSHLDFIWARSAPALINEVILQNLKTAK